MSFQKCPESPKMHLGSPFSPAPVEDGAVCSSCHRVGATMSALSTLRDIAKGMGICLEGFFSKASDLASICHSQLPLEFAHKKSL